MQQNYDAVAFHLKSALDVASEIGIDDRMLAKGGVQSLLIAHYLGHDLSKFGQGHDASDADGRTYEYKATNAQKPQCLFIFSKAGSLDDAITKKIDGLYGVVFAIFRGGAVETCLFARALDFASFVRNHFSRVTSEVDKGKSRRGRPRASTTAESRALNLTKQTFLQIPGVVEMPKSRTASS